MRFAPVWPGAISAPRLGTSSAFCLVMIETADAVDRLDDILDVPAVDGVLVGPNDLAISHTGETTGAAKSQKDVEMILRIGEGCQKRGLAGAISAVDVADAKRWAAAGFNLIGLSSDSALLGQGLSRALDTARAAV